MNIKIIKNTYFFCLTSLLFSASSWARPEYAATHGYVSCTVCHVSPFGGGIRNEEGKLYGQRGLKISSLSKKAWFQVDLRSEVLHSDSQVQERRGLVLMTNNASVHIPVIEDADTGNESMGVVLSNDFGLLSSGLGDSYAFFNLDADSTLAKQKVSNSYIVVGRFRTPFGLANDEHRTYVRLQTRNTMVDYEAGLAFASTVNSVFHYDLAATSGFSDGGSTFHSSNKQTKTDDSPYGLVANVRLNPFVLPMLIGFSYKHDSSNAYPIAADASSVYVVIPTGQFTKNYFKGSLLVEQVNSKGWNNTTINPAMGRTFFPTGTWATSLTNSAAQGDLVQLNWDYSPRWSYLVKYEYFIPDLSYSSDYFTRTGVGGKYFINANTDINARYEKSTTTRPGLAETSTLPAVQDFIYLLLHIWI